MTDIHSTQSSAAAQVMDREEILSRLQGLLKEALMLESVDLLKPEARFREDLETDSLAMVDIALAVEEGFGIKLRSDLNLFDEVKTVGNVVDLVERQLAKKFGLAQTAEALS